MPFSSLPLSYCTNVHPGRTLSEVQSGLQTYTTELQKNATGDIAAGLWLARSVIDDVLAAPDGIARLNEWLHERDLSCYTLNAFPFGDFHSERVKENVYIPDWSTEKRLQYTIDCAKVLAGLLNDDQDGSISTVPLGFAGFSYADDFEEQCFANLVSQAKQLDELRSSTGRMIRLAIEPEPLCLLEKIEDQTLAFFRRLREYATATGYGDIVQEHIGVCFDVCHQSVEFEDVVRCVQLLNDENIRINKVHITCAIEIQDPANNPDARQALAEYVEPRYLHQTFARLHDGAILNRTDLAAEDVLRDPPDRFMQADRWRVHFHVPVNADSLGPLSTTRPDLRAALSAVRDLPYSPHLEVETYTWGVMPGAQQGWLVDALTKEMDGTRSLLSELADG